MHWKTLRLSIDKQPDRNAFYSPLVEVNDLPRFKWRGLMLDVSRHFIPFEVWKRNVDAMAIVKMNVLHLHSVG